MSRALPWTGFAQKFKDFSRSPGRNGSAEEIRLYHRRACLAATEERFDDALIFCGKALQIDPRDLSTRLLIARIYDRGFHDIDLAVAAYRKVITLAGYDSDDLYCRAARVALDVLIQANSHEHVVATLAPISE
jgi:hypothetical protein